MSEQKIVTMKNLLEVNEIFKRLNILRRWTSITYNSCYTEAPKQALNCITAFMLATEQENLGKTINWDLFPKIAIYRAFQKAYIYFDTPEHIIDEICSIGKLDKNLFNLTTQKKICNLTNEDFSNFISECLGTPEMEIYRAATKIATLVELEANSSFINLEEYKKKSMEIRNSINQFNHLPELSKYTDTQGNWFELLLSFSRLRNQIRWSVLPYNINCTVLGHLFETAIFSYFIGLEIPKYEKDATKLFFLGLFHDLAEIWTTDIPSPIKNEIPGFRKATEDYERFVLNKYLYEKLPEYLSNKFRSVMFEETENIDYHKLIKSADYLSADAECWRQYVKGCKDPYFIKAILNFNVSLEDNKFYLPNTCRLLHEFYLSDSMKKI